MSADPGPGCGRCKNRRSTPIPGEQLELIRDGSPASSANQRMPLSCRVEAGEKTAPFAPLRINHQELGSRLAPWSATTRWCPWPWCFIKPPWPKSGAPEQPHPPAQKTRPDNPHQYQTSVITTSAASYYPLFFFFVQLAPSPAVCHGGYEY